MLFALAFICTFVIGGLTGLFLGNVSVDIPLSGTYFVVAHFHMVMGVAPLLVVFGGIYHWYPEDHRPHAGRPRWASCISGSPSSAPTRSIFPMHYLGILGMPRRYYNFDDYQFIPPSAHSLNTFITVVALMVGVAQLVFVFNLVLEPCAAGRPTPTRGAPPRWNGRRPQTPPVHGNWGAAAAGGLPLGLCLQRAGRGGRLHPPERAARGRRAGARGAGSQAGG